MTSETDDRAITLGHPDFEYTQIPARDGIPYGNIKRSNRYPNNTFFTNWKSVKDSITWDIDVLEDGKFEVEIYYTLAVWKTTVTQEWNLMSKILNQNVWVKYTLEKEGEK